MEVDPKALEREAYNFLSKNQFEEAFWLFKRAAQIYRSQANHKQAAICFASAASCWSRKSGESIFHNAASSYENAAKEAEVSSDYEYASLLYRYAAINHERDREFFEYSACFYKSKECYRIFLSQALLKPQRTITMAMKQKQPIILGIFCKIFSWIGLSFSHILWGHGERPFRALFAAILVVIISSLFYTIGFLKEGEIIFRPDFLQSIYFSVVTFTTVGYGDFSPIGFNKVIAIIESFSGLFIIPLFIIGLSRKHLRV